MNLGITAEYCEAGSWRGTRPGEALSGLTRHRTQGAVHAPPYDYIFASPELQTESCEYPRNWLERDERKWRLSDHAPVEAELSLAG